ncbi:hypothetical protein GQ53DRAFT_779885 [Thozetella sp. PMI_491]|nr:hypothetical protein GQ53DRAFT_779885 [Thozetella sp. PMI_491]
MAALTELNAIAVAQICFFALSLGIAILLASRHGFGRNAGWLYLIVFSVARVLGAAFALATINDPTNLSLIAGAATLQSIGLAPLILVMLALLGRVQESIRLTRSTLVNGRVLRIIQLVVIVGLVLGIVGGSELSSIVTDAYSHPNPDGSISYNVPSESRAGTALMIVGFAFVVMLALYTGTQIRDAQAGEKRLLLAVAVAIPFVLVRLIFAAIGTLGSDSNFRSFGGGPNYVHYYLGMAVIVEMIPVAIFEAVGLTLQKKAGHASRAV